MEKPSFNVKEFNNQKEVMLQLMWTKKTEQGKNVNDENMLINFGKWKDKWDQDK
jgi:hypothetical protein